MEEEEIFLREDKLPNLDKDDDDDILGLERLGEDCTPSKPSGTIVMDGANEESGGVVEVVEEEGEEPKVYTLELNPLSKKEVETRRSFAEEDTSRCFLDRLAR
jgi:hypothetical protein